MKTYYGYTTEELTRRYWNGKVRDGFIDKLPEWVKLELANKIDDSKLIVAQAARIKELEAALGNTLNMLQAIRSPYTDWDGWELGNGIQVGDKWNECEHAARETLAGEVAVQS